MPRLVGFDAVPGAGRAFDEQEVDRRQRGAVGVVGMPRHAFRGLEHLPIPPALGMWGEGEGIDQMLRTRVQLILVGIARAARATTDRSRAALRAAARRRARELDDAGGCGDSRR